MKLPLKTLVLILTSLLLVSLKVGDDIELDQFLAARTHPNFLSYTRNIKTTLAKGTKGKVAEVKNFSSGNAGIKMLIASGPFKGQSYWVYYNRKAPALRLIKTNGEEAISSAPLVNLRSAQTKEKIQAIRDPDEHALIETAKEVSNHLSRKNSTEIKLPAVDCISTIKTIAEADYNVTESVAPFRETPRKLGGSSVCRASGEGYDICNREGLPEKIQLANNGPNAIVPTNEYYINRTFEFEFEDRARSDMKLLISDAPDDRTSRVTYSIMLFFPRSVLPSVKRTGDVLDVTLSNGEKVQFNAKTKEIIGGVLSEEKMAQDPKTKKAIPARVKYNGPGVTIRADKSGDLPYGDIERSDGSTAPSISIATVSKKGHKDCKIPSKDIWHNDKEKENVLIKPELTTDAGLDQFIKKRCGFSIF